MPRKHSTTEGRHDGTDELGMLPTALGAPASLAGPDCERIMEACSVKEVVSTEDNGKGAFTKIVEGPWSRIVALCAYWTANPPTPRSDTSCSRERKSGNSNREKRQLRERKGVEAKRQFSRWVNRSFSLICSIFAWFVYFAVPTAFFSGRNRSQQKPHSPHRSREIRNYLIPGSGWVCRRCRRNRLTQAGCSCLVGLHSPRVSERPIGTEISWLWLVPK